jgi:hypothetical protein
MAERKILGDFTGSSDHTWVVLDQGQGPIMMYWDHPDSYGEEGGDYTVYWWSIEDDVMKELDWVDWDGVAKYMGLNKEDKAAMFAAGTNPDPVVRADVYATLIGYVSIGELDSSPSQFSPMEMHFEWPDYVDFPDIDFEEQLFSGGAKVTEDPTLDSTGGFRVELSGQDVEITEWTDIEDATGEDQPEGEKVSRQDATCSLEDLFDTRAPHRGTYSGDDKKLGFKDAMKLEPEARQKAIVDAAIGYIGYGRGVDESYVPDVGD